MTAESRSVVVRLTAENAQYIREIQRSGKVTVEEMAKAERSVKDTGAALDSMGAKAGKIGAAAAVGLAAVGKAAVDWESQWAGVTKTVDGSAKEMGQLEGELRGLAKTLPATHEEIAGVAEAAGQLGVAREDLVDFTETMVALGETTNLTADAAATNIAQISNVMGTAGEDVDNFGAALVALGNDGASTEAQILDMTQRIAGAGAQIGLAEHEILAIANAAASMGIEAEAGGSSISRVFTELAKATKSGGPNLQQFARVAGQSSQAFIKSFESDPARAFAAFTKGLDRINKSGGDVFTVLDDLGLADIRVSQALLGMAASGDLLTDSLDLGAQAWQENTALTKEAEKRYDTTASRIQVAWNQIKDAGIEAGTVLLPILADTAKFVGTLADAFGALPDPVQDSFTAMLGITAVLGGGLWFTSKVVGGIRSTRAELRLLTAEGTRTAAALNATGGAIGRVGKLQGAAVLAGVGVAATGAAEGIGLTNTASLALMGTIAGPWGAAIGAGAGLVMDLADSQKILARATAEADAAMQSQNINQMSDQLASLNKDLRELDDLDAGTVANILKGAVEGTFTLDYEEALFGDFDALKAKRDEVAQAISDLQSDMFFEYFPNNQSPIDRVFLEPFGRIASQAKVTGQAISDLTAEFEQMNAALSGRASLRDYEAAIDAIGAALERNGKGLNINTEAGRDNQATLDSIASTSIKVAETLKGIDQVRFLRRARRDFIDAATDLGLTRAQARALADDLGLVGRQRPKPKVEVQGTEDAKAKINSVDWMLQGLNGDTATVTVRAIVTGAAAAAATIANLQSRAGLNPFQAEGGFYPRFYAAGGLDRANQHEPEMARAGALRIWAEPETGGETYIPHANDHRRPAAKRYLEQTATLFGGHVEWFADGGHSSWSDRPYVRRTAVTPGGAASLHVTGTLATPWGPATIEGIARDVARQEIDASAYPARTGQHMHRGGDRG